MPQCEGWTRYGGIFTFGPVEWKQCPNDGVVMIHFKDKKGELTKPACMECWQKLIDSPDYEILEATPIPEEETGGD